MSCVHSRMSCDHWRTGCVHSTHARCLWRLHCAFTAHLLRNVCSAIARRFFLTCSKFDGARSACGICLAHLGDSTAYVRRTRSVNDPRAYVAYLPRNCYFFVRRVSAVHRRPVEQLTIDTWSIPTMELTIIAGVRVFFINSSYCWILILVRILGFKLQRTCLFWKYSSWYS